MKLTGIGNNGEIVIPTAIGETLQIDPNTRIVVSREGNRIILEPVNKEYVRAPRGLTSGGPSVTDSLSQGTPRRGAPAEMLARV